MTEDEEDEEKGQKLPRRGCIKWSNGVKRYIMNVTYYLEKRKIVITIKKIAPGRENTLFSTDDNFSKNF